MEYSYVDFNEILDMLRYNSSTFRERTFANQFTNDWYRAFKNSWKSYYHEIANADLSDAYHKYLCLGKTKIWLTLDIKKLKNESVEQTLQLSKNDFLGQSSLISFSKENQKAVTKGPIMMIPWPMQCKYLVVDGNHRVSDFLSSNRRELGSHLYSFENSKHAFVTQFDKAFYSYTFECECFWRRKDLDNLMSESLSREFW